MNIPSTFTSGVYRNLNTRNTAAKGMSQTASTQSSSKDIVEISGKKTVDGTSATEEFENNTSLPDEFVKKIREMAKEGAQKGVYKGDEYIAYMNAYKKQHISPNRSKLLMGLNNILSNLSHITSRFQTFSFMGFHANVDFYSGAAVFYNSNGEKIMGCDSDGDVMEFPTKAEQKFHREMNALYEEAYDAARAEMKAAAQGQGQAPANTATLDTLA